MYRIGIDVGGTFTDFTLLDDERVQVHFHKVPSTPSDPSEAIARGLSELLVAHRIEPSAVRHIGHGTTVATNLVIERRGARAGLLTTRGFRDVMEIGRQVRPHLYDYSRGKPPPLIARRRRFELHERIDARGTVAQPLEDPDLEAAIARLRACEVEAVAICFLHSYRNPVHEQRARAALERLLSGVYLSVSSEVLPEFREFERLSTTALNAVVGPRMQTYLERFLERVRSLGIEVEPFTIHSNGGLMSVRSVQSCPVRTCLSGPAAGVVGAAELGKAAQFRNVVTFDVGGTSTDVSLVVDGAPLFTSLRAIADYPVKTPMVDVHVIGAGGGSIAAIDDAGALKVGPLSAGADPGPAAYARGGMAATLTDAHVVLQRLNPVSLLDGRLPIDAGRARAVVEEKIARPLGLSVEDAAEGIIRIANANMGRAIRAVSTERGYDLGQFALFAYGGAGPLHAIDVAGECGIGTVVVPQEPGTLCARGMLLTNVSFDFVRSLIAPATPAAWESVRRLLAAMRAEAEQWLEQERVAAPDRLFHCHIDARYQGQNFEVLVRLADFETDRERFLQDFAAAHCREYGYALQDRPVEIVNCRLQAVGIVPRAPLCRYQGGGRVEAALAGRRKVYFGRSHGWLQTPVYARADLAAGTVLTGPAVIEEMSSTVVLAPPMRAAIDSLGNIVVELRECG